MIEYEPPVFEEPPVETVELIVAEADSWTLSEVILSHETQQLAPIEVLIDPSLSQYVSYEESERKFTYDGDTGVASLHELAPFEIGITLRD